jgi:hypothetical protein
MNYRQFKMEFISSSMVYLPLHTLLLEDELPVTAAPRPEIRRCRGCQAVLLVADYIGRGAGAMDKALTYHSCGTCASDEAFAASMVAEFKSVLGSGGDEGEPDSAACAPPVTWPDGEPPLVYLARVGKVECALNLLRSGLAASCGGVNARGRFGMTALHHAAARNDTTLLRTLVAEGASTWLTTQDDVNAGVTGGRTPLHAAAAAGAAASAALLVELDPTSAARTDWEDRLPAELAWLGEIEGAHELAISLVEAARRASAADPPAASGEIEGDRTILSSIEVEVHVDAIEETELTELDGERQHARTLSKVELRERHRAALDIEARPRLHTAHLIKGAWTADRCGASDCHCSPMMVSDCH